MGSRETQYNEWVMNGNNYILYEPKSQCSENSIYDYNSEIPVPEKISL